MLEPRWGGFWYQFFFFFAEDRKDRGAQKGGEVGLSIGP